MASLEDFYNHTKTFFSGKETNEEVEVEVKQAKEDVEVKEEVKDEVKEVEAPQPMYVTSEQLFELELRLTSMIKAIIEENKKDVQEVPQKLSKIEEQEEETKEEKVELSEEVTEIVHSPENEVEKEPLKLHKPYGMMTPAERIRFNLKQFRNA